MPLNDHLRKLWDDAGYVEGRRMGSAAVTAPPGPEFRRVYHITPSEFAISDIVFKRVKVARFSALNDPFEMLAPKFTDRAFGKMLGNFKRKFDAENGLICFSADWTDPVLWTHYGARHTGICLGFNVKKEFLRKVDYVSRRVVSHLPYDTITSTLEEVIVCTKFESWRYEDEYRVVVDLKHAKKEGTLYFLRFDDDVELAEVIIGARSDVRATQLRKIVDKHHKGVTTIKARLAIKSFNIVPLEASVQQVPS
jgi:hypothetical protein